MPRIDRQRAHRKSLDDARISLAAAVEDVRAGIPGGAPAPQWNADRSSVSVAGDMFTASMTVDAVDVKVIVDLSFFAGFLKGTVAAEVDKVLDKHFGAPASAGG
jgi:hypothetical protein